MDVSKARLLVLHANSRLFSRSSLLLLLQLHLPLQLFLLPFQPLILLLLLHHLLLHQLHHVLVRHAHVASVIFLLEIIIDQTHALLHGPIHPFHRQSVRHFLLPHKVLGGYAVLIFQLFRERRDVPGLQIFVFHRHEFFGGGEQVFFRETSEGGGGGSGGCRAAVLAVCFGYGNGFAVLPYDASVVVHCRAEALSATFGGIIDAGHGQSVGHFLVTQEVFRANVKLGLQFVLDVGGVREGGLDAFKFEGYLKFAEFGTVGFW
mmetsp:Transcript_16295/g.34420  ORF Transcript_16295/g.34420 Transcript_16295/m.34420 type:complete len:262 (-) Transcript_16295:214-999(-)